MLRFVHNTRQRLLRLKALATPAVLMKHKGGSKAISYLADIRAHASILQQAAESLYFSHQSFATIHPVPLFDVQTALDIATRGVLELPSYISSFAPDLKPPPGRREQLIIECNALVLQLFQSVQLPPGLRLHQVRACLHVFPLALQLQLQDNVSSGVDISCTRRTQGCVLHCICYSKYHSAYALFWLQLFLVMAKPLTEWFLGARWFPGARHII
jgi:hypothetical protein